MWHCARFYAVGAIGIVVQLAALALFKSGLRMDYLLATALAVEVAVLHNFFGTSVGPGPTALVRFPPAA